LRSCRQLVRLMQMHCAGNFAQLRWLAMAATTRIECPKAIGNNL
jgi:hypothetical protein